MDVSLFSISTTTTMVAAYRSHVDPCDHYVCLANWQPCMAHACQMKIAVESANSWLALNVWCQILAEQMSLEGRFVHLN